MELNDLVTIVMARFFEGLEQMDATAFPAMKAEYHWWAHEHMELQTDITKADGQVLVSPMGIYVPNGYLEDIYDDGVQYVPLPEGKFYLAESDQVRSDLETYFENSLKGMQ